MKTFDHSPGLIVYNLFPLLVGPPGAWAGHLSRIRDMGFDTVFVNPFHLSGCSGSIYAIKNTDLLDPRFQYAPGDGDEVIQQFCEQARRNNLSVMIDLVINHAARDSVLVDVRPELFARERDGGLVTPWAVDIGSETGKVFWDDLALFNYADPLAKQLLINHWDTYVSRFQRLGVSSFRCDAAHMVPADVWLELILRAKTRDPDCVFVAETLGCTLETAVDIAQVGFGYIMSNFAYSEFKDLRALVEYERLHTLAPSIAFPESHDTERLAARFDPHDLDAISQELMFRYMLAAFFTTGVMMPLGYEWGYRRKIDVAKSTPQDQEQTGLDISSQIAEVNQLRRRLPPLNIEGVQKRLSQPDDPVLVLLRGDDHHLQRSRCATLVFANTSEEPVLRSGASLVNNVGPFDDFVDHTPMRQPSNLTEDLTLLPKEVRIFQGGRV